MVTRANTLLARQDGATVKLKLIQALAAAGTYWVLGLGLARDWCLLKLARSGACWNLWDLLGLAGTETC